MTFTAIQLTGCHIIQDLGVGNLGTDLTVLYTFFFCLLVLYFYVALAFRGSGH